MIEVSEDRKQATISIIKRFGGLSDMARVLGVPIPTVQGWLRSGLIPARRQEIILAAARSQGLDMRPEDFFKAPVVELRREAS